jgi:hypothetical protein
MPRTCADARRPLAFAIVILLSLASSTMSQAVPPGSRADKEQIAAIIDS